MGDQIHSELIIKEEQDGEDDDIKKGRCSTESGKSITHDASAIGIRPKPLICKPENVSCKSEPIETKWQWAPGAWQDATRTSAFQPYKVLFRIFLSFGKGRGIFNVTKFPSCGTLPCHSQLLQSEISNHKSILSTVESFSIKNWVNI